MKFRLKVGPYYGVCESGSKQFLHLVKWMHRARDHLGTSLKDTKALVDHLREAVEERGGYFKGASIVVDTVQFPFLAKHEYIPDNGVIEFINEDVPHATCIDATGMFTISHSAEVIKEALLKLIDMHSWSEARRLCEVLEDIDINSVPSGPFASAQ